MTPEEILDAAKPVAGCIWPTRPIIERLATMLRDIEDFKSLGDFNCETGLLE